MDTNTILDKAIEDVRKRHGVQIMTLSSIKADEVDSISTGSLSLDVATGVLGIPRGRIIEIYGPESSGKTTVCFSIVREAQSKGLRCLYIDMEQAVDVAYARKLGVDLQSLYFVQPESAEMALDIAETFLKNSAMDLIVIDSVASLVPQAEIENSMGESTMGLQARLMGQA
ncbi:MAG: DNA recombination/repair protein RecA, partial [Azovibrio sp.]|nr:DNA recombination/repair protein RecA [Azovibrio sp.]